MSGLPDEAVRAAWQALIDNYLGAPTLDQARAALAALPAGVYRSDGKGKVEAVDALLIDELARSRSGRSRSQWAAAHEVYREFWRGPVRQVLAALSATDTETR